MNSNVTGKLRAEFNDGDVKEKDINARAVFLVSIAVNKEDLSEDKEAMDVALLGATNMTEFIERVAEAMIAILGHMAGGKVPAGVLYYKLMDRMTKCISDKADDADMSMMHILMGDEREQES